MTRRGGMTIQRLGALLLGAVLVAGCSAKPVSQAVASTGPAETEPAPPSAPAASSASPGAPGDPSPTPPRTPKPPSRIPDKPADVTYELVSTEELGSERRRVTWRITWSAREGEASSFTVVGVTDCLRYAKKHAGKPCLVRGMRIPKDVQEVITKVPGTERSVDISWEESGLDVGPWRAILVRASNALGDSIFTIAWSDTVCWKCTY